MLLHEAIAKLERIRDTHPDPRVRRQAELFITEAMEDYVDHGGDWVLPQPFDEWVSELTPPPHVDWEL